MQFALHLNLLGETQTISGPMEIGESVSIKCINQGIILQLTLMFFSYSISDFTFDYEIMHKNKVYPVTKIIATVRNYTLIFYILKLQEN